MLNVWKTLLSFSKYFSSNTFSQNIKDGPRSAVGTCLAAYPGITSSIPARSHTFVEIISMVILLPSAESFKKGCCQLQVKVFARSTGLLLVQACPGKSVVK